MARDHFKEASNAITRFQSQMVKAITGYYRLSDFIGALRASTTMAQERSLIAKEAFAIRSALKEPDLGLDHRYHSIAKLVLLVMLGQSGHYGQVECMKLASSQRLADKRMGYYGACQLLDQWQPTLTLLTNSLKHDLASGDVLLQGQALLCLSQLGSVEMAWELADEVERLLATMTLPSLNRKAAMCAAQLVRLVPDLAETMATHLHPLLVHPHHAVLMGGLCLLEAVTGTMDPASLASAHLSGLLRQLNAIQAGRGAANSPLPSTRYSNYYPGTVSESISVADYDVHGVHDPFVQVKILQLLRRLAAWASTEQLASLADALTILLASIDPHRPAGQAVLVEAIMTCLRLDEREHADLHALAMSQLGRLLERNEDANLRYVLLNLLARSIQREEIIPSRSASASPIDGSVGAGKGNLVRLLQRQRQHVLTCIDDGDSSIRQLAMRVALLLIDDERMAVEIVPKLLDGLCHEDEFEPDQRLARDLALVIGQHAPSDDWYLQTMTRLLTNFKEVDSISDQVVTALLNRIPSLGSEEQLSLFLQSKQRSEPWKQAACWYIGQSGTVEQLESIETSNPVTLSYLVMALGRLGADGLLLQLAQKHSQNPELVQRISEQVAMIKSGVVRPKVKGMDKVENNLSSLFASQRLSASQVDESQLGTSVYNQHSVHVFIRVESLSPQLQLTISYYHTLACPLTRLHLQVAVPRNQQADLGAASLPFPLRPKQVCSQSVTISWRDRPEESVMPAEVRLRLRMEIDLPLSEQPLIEIVDHAFQ